MRLSTKNDRTLLANSARPSHRHHMAHPSPILPRHCPPLPRRQGMKVVTPEWKEGTCSGRHFLRGNCRCPSVCFQEAPHLPRYQPLLPGTHLQFPAAKTHLDWVCFVMFLMVAPSLPMMAPTYWVGTRSRRGISTCCCLAGAPAATGEPWRG